MSRRSSRREPPAADPCPRSRPRLQERLVGPGSASRNADGQPFWSKSGSLSGTFFPLGIPFSLLLSDPRGGYAAGSKSHFD